MDDLYDVIIIGSGPSGLTAAIYTTRANLKTLVIAGLKWGGQLMLTTEVENFPGFPEGILGPDLMQNMRKQAEHHGAKIIDADFKSADYGSTPLKVTASDGQVYKGRKLLIATGADTKWLNVPGEEAKIGRGVSTCAPCDGAFFRNKNVIVVGGGDSAMEEALVMTKYANEVTLIHRRDEFRASQIMQQRVKEHPKIKIILNSEITEILGEMKVEKVKIKDVKTGSVTEMPIDGIFVAIGHIPNSAVFDGIDVDEKGFIKVGPNMRTNLSNVYVAGDVHDHVYKQAVTAAAFGCQAALEIEKDLMNEK